MAVAFQAALTGCGGGDEGAAESSSRLSNTAFVRQANIACKKERTNLQEEATVFLERQPRTKPQEKLYADLAHLVLVPTIERQIFRIEELNGLPYFEERIDNKVLDIERRAIDRVATTLRIGSIEKGVYQRFAKSAQRFREFGMRECANGPKPPPELVSRF